MSRKAGRVGSAKEQGRELCGREVKVCAPPQTTNMIMVTIGRTDCVIVAENTPIRREFRPSLKSRKTRARRIRRKIARLPAPANHSRMFF